MGRIGIYGGTFNPPHAGHVAAAQYAQKALELDRLLVLPDHIPPHKQLPDFSPAPEQRLELCRLAFAGIPGTQVSDLTFRLQGPTYTVNTVRLMRKAYPQDRLILLLGEDMFLSFLSWKEPRAILQEAELAVFCRSGRSRREELLAQQRAVQELGGRVTLLPNPVVEISSTQLRRLLAFGCAGQFLSPGVLEHIRREGLYDTAAGWKHLPMEELQAVVTALLNPNRVAHVLGCRQAALELAKLWGADPTDAQRAALLHDVTKALDGPLQLTLCREYGTILNAFSTNNPKTLHAFTGSLVAEKIFGENPAVVSAIASHTTGKPAMNTLEKIIYVADYMEPNRDFPGVEALRSLAYTDLDKALKLGLEMTLAMLKQQNREISPESAAAVAYLRQQGV